jgi:DNA-binding transcriptional LysR family regulator
MRNIDPNLVRAFLMVVETANVTKASRLLNVTQAAVSQQLMRLESLLGLQLFERSKQGLYPTPAAERLLSSARQFLTLNDEIACFAGTQEFEGEVRLGCPDDLIGPFLPEILRSFSIIRPHVRVTLVCRTTPELLTALTAGQVDLAITTEETDQSPEAITLLEDQLVLVGAPSGRVHTQRPLPVSLGSTSYGLRPATVRCLSNAGIEWQVVSEVSHIEVICALVRAGLVVAPLLRSTVPRDLTILGPAQGLPILPDFNINLHSALKEGDANKAELIVHIEKEFHSRATMNRFT